NTGGIDLDTISEIKRQRIPIHTVGFGREQMARDVEVTDVQLPARSLARSRLEAQVSFHQRGFGGGKGHLVVRESGGKVLAARDVTFKGDGAAQTEAVLFNAGDPGVKNLDFAIDTLPGEENPNNNKQTRVLNVDAAKPRILYMEGEPRWDYKFLRRAVEDDKNIALYSIVRTTQNKNYTQTPDDKHPELKNAFPFPTKVEDLFDFQGLILGSIEANYFTPQQQEMIQQFVDRRGGGLLFLGGRSALAEGGYDKPPFDDLLPVHLPTHKGTFHRDHANAELTSSGRDSLITRIEEDPGKNIDRWNKLPYMLSYQEAGTAKPGATVLAEMKVGGRTLPLLITQKYGRGRSAVFATGSDWTWQMLQPLEDMSHEIFWRQMLRWLVSDTPTRVVASTPSATLEDDGHVRLRAEVRDSTYLPTSDADVQARLVGPNGASETVELHPDPTSQGVYLADWNAEHPGSYITEVVAHRGQQELGRDVVTFRRENGIAENFHLEQNRDLLEKLSSQTGGRYYRPNEVSRLGEDISYSEAGISVRETKDLWDMPVVFFFALLLCCTEWLLRRRWGVV
ncbi:MAG TPA: glutamine amidotransferase, partial [Bryobacteraceae bacterium]|nr:glutamine amidotransferase [Bryobacteraceae bacterium]